MNGPGRRARVIDGTLISLVALLAGLAGLAWLRGGPPLAREGLDAGAEMLLRFGPVIVVSFLAAGYAALLIPTDWVREQLGPESGLRGIALAVGAGMITPSGPFVSFPIAAILIRSGAGAAAVVAFVAAWMLLAVHRLVAWEVPILGWRFALLRYGCCLALPFAAGLIARALGR